MLIIPLADFFRATLAEDTGNIGFMGLAPDGESHHVVVPVDLQIARGIKACNRPDDGTPFGGYTGWSYFECPPCPVRKADEDALRRDRWRQARATAVDFIHWAAARQLKVTVEPDPTAVV